LPDDLETKRLRERRRRAKFTPEQRAAANAHSNLYLQHRRNTDVAFLAKSRESVRRTRAKRREAERAAMRNRHWETRLRCLRVYARTSTPFCSFCGEDHQEFLTLDHIVDRRNDDGVRVGGNRMGQNLFSWMIRMDFPPGFRVLCYNCNCARGSRGYCPHELELDAAIDRMVV